MSYILPVKVDKGSGEPIILLHGLGNNYKSWTYVLDNLDYDKNRVIALDLLGFGDADKPKDCDYTVSDHAEAVIETLDKLGIKDALVAGHSMGCLVAEEAARQRPDMVARLILLGNPLFKKLPSRYDKFKFWQPESAYVKIFRFISIEKDMTLMSAKAVRRFAPLIKGMEITEQTWPAFKNSLRNTILQTKSYDDLAKLKTPSLLVYGKLDVFVIKRNLVSATRRNKRYVSFKPMLGPHEITPVSGKSIAKLIQSGC